MPSLAVAPPARLRRISTLAGVDYEDAFALELGPAAGERTAEGWIREMLEGAPPEMRGRLVAGWSALGLKLGSRSDPNRVLGWEVRSATVDAVVLGAESRVGMPAELILLRGKTALTFSTQVRFRNPLVRLTWRAVQPAHVRIVPDLLAGVGRRAGAR